MHRKRDREAIGLPPPVAPESGTVVDSTVQTDMSVADIGPPPNVHSDQRAGPAPARWPRVAGLVAICLIAFAVETVLRNALPQAKPSPYALLFLLPHSQTPAATQADANGQIAYELGIFNGTGHAQNYALTSVLQDGQRWAGANVSVPAHATRQRVIAGPPPVVGCGRRLLISLGLVTRSKTVPQTSLQIYIPSALLARRARSARAGRALCR
jgi:hypothetical protein